MERDKGIPEIFFNRYVFHSSHTTKNLHSLLADFNAGLAGEHFAGRVRERGHDGACRLVADVVDGHFQSVTLADDVLATDGVIFPGELPPYPELPPAE